jgi:hypothetical protein
MKYQFARRYKASRSANERARQKLRTCGQRSCLTPLWTRPMLRRILQARMSTVIAQGWRGTASSNHILHPPRLHVKLSYHDLSNACFLALAMELWVLS